MRTRTRVSLLSSSLAATLLTGCGVGTLAPTSVLDQGTAAKASLPGKIMGGQQPIIGATVVLYAVGNSGYGSTASPLAVSETDNNGQFYFQSFSCPANAPLYVLSLQGNPQIPNANNTTNPDSELGAGGFTCDHLPSSVVVNEVSTVALAYTMSHYFAIGSSQITYGSLPCTYGTTTTDCTTATGNAPVTTADTFGGPRGTGTHGVYSTGLYNADLYTIPAMVSVGTGSAQNTATVQNVTTTVETAKINSLADVLANCVNSDPSTGGTCSTLLSETSSTSPSFTSTNTLEAAVFTALNPYQNQSPLYNLIPVTPPFSPTIANQPNDWSLAVSYSSPSFNLSVPTGAVSTIDIDTAGNVWFPSNGSYPGIAYFSPATGAFSNLLNATSASAAVVTPTQVAIDQSGYVWANDTASSNVLEYNGSNASSVSILNVGSASSGSTTSALTINRNAFVDVAVQVNGGTSYQFDYITGNNAYLGAQPATTGSNATAAGAISRPVSSLATTFASSGGGSVWTAGTSTSLTPLGEQLNYDGSFAANTFSTANSNVAYGGQAVNIGSSYVALQAYEGSSPDGICQQLYTASCQPFVLSGTSSTTLSGGAYGMAIDGAGMLWASQSLSAGLISSPVSALPRSSSGTAIAQQFLHGSSYGGTASKPYGVAIDNSGNVWMSNASSSGSGFTLTEVIGIAAPTVTPVSAQVSGNNDLTAHTPSY